MDTRKFYTATEEEIKTAETSDVYFKRNKAILEKEGLSNIHVTAEITTGSLPKNWEYGILAGVEETSHLLEGLNVGVRSFPEGTLFRPVDSSGVREAVMVIEGRYLDFCLYETPLLGLLCESAGIATMASGVRKSAVATTVFCFGVIGR